MVYVPSHFQLHSFILHSRSFHILIRSKYYFSHAYHLYLFIVYLTMLS